ncbi:four-carbon acid sugar kinase family protein [Rhodoferax sp.]|uniref:four-carbon acid sugar kinase family protein n=1 Tax=Rhodoferax sp. TaxID=50421 RepID=UPI00374D08F0
MNRWRILADDLTGALDTAAAFCGAQQVPVFLQASTSTAPVQAWSTATRDMPPSDLPAALDACLPWLRAPGHFAFKKVDSLLRGNSFAEVAWLLRHGGFAGAVFAPAFPAQGRFTQDGQHWAGPPQQPGVPQAAIDVRAAFAAEGLSTYTGHALDADGGVLLPDVRSDADLDRIAQLSRQPAAARWLWCGSAGLAWALARCWQHAPASVAAPNSGLTHLVSASRHPVLRGQLTGLAGVTAMPLHDLSSTQPLSAAEARLQLAAGAQQLVHSLPCPANLVVVGGDTLLALCQAAGAHGLHASASPRSGWGRAELQGGVWHGATVYSRSGAFGAPDDLSALLARLTEKETSL